MFRIWIVASAIWVGYCAWRFWASCGLAPHGYDCRIFEAEEFKYFEIIGFRPLVAILICLPIATFLVALAGYWCRTGLRQKPD
jgi:hypothetical protein